MKAGIKSAWPGAKDTSNIDALVQIVLDAPEITDPLLPLASQIAGAWDNVEVVIFKVMDVTDATKVNAILRVINAQTDSTKKSRATVFGWRMFGKFLDPRLLALRKDELDDATAHTEVFEAAEGLPRRPYTVRGDARDYFLSELESTLGMTIDRTPFEIADEAAGCAALKAWLTANWNQIIAKCAEIKAQPGWKPQLSMGTTWDVRW